MGQHVGIFGGTFDPIHVAHLVVAADCRHDLKLDRVLFVVAKDPYQKQNQYVTSASARYGMVSRAVRFQDWAEASDIEIKREGETRTVDTLRILRARNPETEYTLLLGQDQFENRHTWYEWSEIEQTTKIHVTPRWMGVSSTDIRKRIREGRTIKHLVPDCIDLYLQEHSLYPKD